MQALVVETTPRVMEERRREAEERIQLALNAGAMVGTWMRDIPNNRFTADARFAQFFSLDPAQVANGLALGCAGS